MSISTGQLASRYAAAAKDVEGAVNRPLRAMSQVGVGHVKSSIQNYHAVDTGAMLNSTTAETAGKHTYLIGPTVVYAAFVALGTSRVAARPFHLDAARKLNSQARDFGFTPQDLGI